MPQISAEGTLTFFSVIFYILRLMISNHVSTTPWGLWKKGAHVDSNSVWSSHFHICKLPLPNVCYSDHFRSIKDGVQRIKLKRMEKIDNNP